MLRLELSISFPEGRERDAALDLAARVPEPHFRLLAALAAELVAIHESRTALGRTSVLVLPADQAEKVLADLAR